MRNPGVLLSVATVAAIASSAPVERAARAEAEDPPSPFGRTGQLVFSIPRLLPLVAVNSWSVQSSAANDAPTGTWVSFGNHPSGLNVYDLPRLGLDAFAADRLSLGVDLSGYATLGASPTLGNPYVSIFGAAPHIGYVAPFSGVVSLWLRAGIAYYLLAEKGVDAGGAGAGARGVPWSFTWQQLDADVQAHLVLAAFSHMAVTVGLVAEVPLAGRFDEVRTGGAAVDAGAGWVHVGFVGGLLTYL
jgi:hypothetical protein